MAGLAAGIGLTGGSSSGSSLSRAGNWSLGSSASSGFTNSDSWNNAYGYTDGFSAGESWDNSTSEEWGESWGRTYGREASAQDIENAYIANQVQRDLWSEQAAYNMKEAEKSRNYQMYMSNTAYQRAVADLLKAGLNPILAVGNMGASTPVGATATSGLASAAKANAYAESRSGSQNYQSSASNSYSYNRGGTKSESWNQGKSTTRSRESSSSTNRSQGWEYGSSVNNSTNNIRELTQSAIGAVKDLTKQTNPKYWVERGTEGKPSKGAYGGVLARK